MKSYIKIRLEADNPEELQYVIDQIMQVAQAYNMKVVGPVPLPTKELKIVTRRTPCGDGSDTYETWRKRIRKRYITIYGDDKSIRNLLKIKVPPTVYIKIKMGQNKAK
ncbi:MAG: 30S ribosomal protein S10 [Candidatus Micrarchaeota archaeon]|nr:30S ribosomal protein S10 [Candidatus Micrarchaeota archaeon]